MPFMPLRRTGPSVSRVCLGIGIVGRSTGEDDAFRIPDMAPGVNVARAGGCIARAAVH